MQGAGSGGPLASVPPPPRPAPWDSPPAPDSGGLRMCPNRSHDGNPWAMLSPPPTVSGTADGEFGERAE